MGISLCGLVAAKVQEAGRPDLAVVSSPLRGRTWSPWSGRYATEQQSTPQPTPSLQGELPNGRGWPEPTMCPGKPKHKRTPSVARTRDCRVRKRR
jgi:hypothetical protein